MWALMIKNQWIDSEIAEFLLNKSGQHLHLLLHSRHLLARLQRPPCELFPFLLDLADGRLHGFARGFQLPVLAVEVGALLLEEPAGSVEFVLVKSSGVALLDCLHFGGPELLGLEDDFAEELFLGLDHVLVVLDEALDAAHAAGLLVVLSLLQRLSRLHRFSEPADIVAQLSQCPVGHLLGQVEQFGLEGLELKDTVEVAVVASPPSQHFPLHFQHCLQVALDALQAVAVVLVFPRDLLEVFLHGAGHHLIVLVVCVHHDD